MTRATNERPVRRLMARDRFGDEYVVEVRADLILLRPKGSRRGGSAEVAVTPGAVYVRAMTARVDAAKRERKALRKARGKGTRERHAGKARRTP